jgi:hypothetical protein
VVPATIERGVLKAGTSGGTSLECVLEHVAKTRPAVRRDRHRRLHRSDREAAGRGAPPARACTPSSRATAIRPLLKAAGIPYSQLGRLPSMIRVSEAVLPGHPDKLCDFVAESIVQAALAVDAEAYAQIEAGIWCDRLWLSGGYAARGRAARRRADRGRGAGVDRRP